MDDFALWRFLEKSIEIEDCSTLNEKSKQADETKDGQFEDSWQFDEQHYQRIWSSALSSKDLMSSIMKGFDQRNIIIKGGRDWDAEQGAGVGLQS